MQGCSYDTLAAKIRSGAHVRQGAAITNFSARLPQTHSALASGLLKDPYIFDFLTLSEPFHERELETGLVRHLQKFLLEPGQGFSFVGRQYRLEVSDREFYLDLLFYHLTLRCFIVVDLKRAVFERAFLELGKAPAQIARIICSIGGAKVRDKRPAVIPAKLLGVL